MIVMIEFPINSNDKIFTCIRVAHFKEFFFCMSSLSYKNSYLNSFIFEPYLIKINIADCMTTGIINCYKWNITPVNNMVTLPYSAKYTSKKPPPACILQVDRPIQHYIIYDWYHQFPASRMLVGSQIKVHANCL